MTRDLDVRGDAPHERSWSSLRCCRPGAGRCFRLCPSGRGRRRSTAPLGQNHSHRLQIKDSGLWRRYRADAAAPSVPSAPARPFSDAIISALRPDWSTQSTAASWDSSSWTQSTWPENAAACSGVLRGGGREGGRSLGLGTALSVVLVTCTGQWRGLTGLWRLCSRRCPTPSPPSAAPHTARGR